mgnify:CR=1 FL=1
MVKKKSKMAKKEVLKKKKRGETTMVGHEEKRTATKASDELAKYLTENKLDPTKDWAKDPKHGEKIRKLMQVVRVNREKLEDKVDEVKVKNLKKPKINKGGEKIEKQPVAYNYPEVDGKPMDSVLKKKYRAKMRNLLKANMDPKEAAKKALDGILHPAEPSKTTKKVKKDKEATEVKGKKVSKEGKKKDKKKKKSTKEED